MDIGGIGGVALIYSNAQFDRKVFLGGAGGGGGPEDDNVEIGGEKGGGILLIQAGAIVGNGKDIRANGIDNTAFVADYINNAGAGGGGAGGCALLDIASYSGSVIVSANGGKGTNNATYCAGPGGGGGGGTVWLSGTGTPSGMTIQTNGGAAGISVNVSPCNGGTFGASAGGAGVMIDQLVVTTGSVPR